MLLIDVKTSNSEASFHASAPSFVVSVEGQRATAESSHPVSTNFQSHFSSNQFEKTKKRNLHPFGDETKKPLLAMSMLRKRKWYINPQFALLGGCIEIAIMIYMLSSLNIVEGDYFRFGPPLTVFQYTLTTYSQYFGVLFLFFVHQLVFTWLNEVVGPWILNEVQDTNVRIISFSKPKTVVMINTYYIYFTLNSVIMVNVSFSQFSFLLAILFADLIATTTLNMHYIWNKRVVLGTDIESYSDLGESMEMGDMA